MGRILGNWFKSSPVSFSLISIQFSTKGGTHYDTLKLSPTATNNEIKSAYYELTKLYHPDRNKSKQAEEKFRNITEAYDVLSNLKTRKQYDRSIKLGQGTVYTPKTKETKDPHMKEYSQAAALYKTSRSVSASQAYNFDAWTQAHYGETFQRTKAKKKKIQELKIELERDTTGDQPILSPLLMLLIVVFALGITSAYHAQPSNVKQHSNLDNIDIDTKK